MTEMIAQLCAELTEAHAQIEELSALPGEIEHRDTRLAEVWELTSTGRVAAEQNSLCEIVTQDIDAVVAALGYDNTDWADLGDVKRLAEESQERPQQALEALRRYLVRCGLPADPVRLDDPDLWALYEALA